MGGRRNTMFVVMWAVAASFTSLIDVASAAEGNFNSRVYDITVVISRAR